MKRIDPLGVLMLFITVVTAFVFLFTSGASAEGNVAVNLAGVTGDNAWGVIGNYEKGIFEIEGNLQSGESYSGNLDRGGHPFRLLQDSVEKHPKRTHA